MDEKTIKDKYAEMSADAKKILFSNDAAAKLFDICESYEITDKDQMAIVTEAVIMILLDVQEFSSLTETLQKTGISKENADDMADLIHKEIISPASFEKKATVPTNKNAAIDIRNTIKKEMNVQDLLKKISSSPQTHE